MQLLKQGSSTSASTGKNGHLADVSRMMYGMDGAGSTGAVGSSMSQGALHDHLRRKAQTRLRND